MRSLLIFLILINVDTLAQQSVIDSLKQVLSRTNDDSTKFCLSVQIGELYTFNNADSSINYIKKATALADNKRDPLWRAHANYAVSLYFYIAGDDASALYFSFKNVNEFEQYRDPYVLTLSTHMISSVYENEKALFGTRRHMSYAFKTIALLDTLHYVNNMYGIHFLNSKGKTLIATYTGLASTYIKLNKIDSALFYGQKGYEVNQTEQINWNFPLLRLAIIYEKMGRIDSALIFYRNALPMAIKENIMVDVVKNYLGRAELFKKKGLSDSTIFYARKAVAQERGINYKQGALEASLLLSEAYENKHMNDSAFRYYKYAMATKDSLFNQEKIQQIQGITFKEELKERERQQQVVLERTEYRNKIRIYTLLVALGFFLLLAVILYRSNRNKQKAKLKIEKAYEQLKSTQAQLIQSEKMASLGELTAGIAHEIQNPLNFVNNFSEVSNELIDEMKDELSKGNYEDVNDIANDVKQNLEKINHHGKRADAIVKGMLQHSRTSTGQKEPTDINALCDEYLRLSYHGLRAKDKEFNASMKTDFDESIGSINIIPQDIGRVLLNLYNNAFYAVTEKKKQQTENYEPTVSIKTKKLDNKIEVCVKDNGNGIPQKIVDKIFQPFFTTKPTGQGTGLGLSLSYDIIKAYGGEIKVETKEGEGSEFIIQISIT